MEKVIGKFKIVETDEGYRIEIKGDKEKMKEIFSGLRCANSAAATFTLSTSDSPVASGARWAPGVASGRKRKRAQNSAETAI